MSEVDAVWAQVPFRTPWSAAREREEVRRALTRFIAWHNRPDARTVLATEHRFEAEVELDGGEVVRLHGYADRLELDDAGRVVVVDLKTGKYPASDLPRHPQLGLYQLAVDRGGVADLAGDAGSGGAELWQLRQDSRTGLKVQEQAPQQPGPDGRTPVQEQLADAVAAIRAERFEARPGGHCERCAFRCAVPDPGLGDGAPLMPTPVATRIATPIASPADLRRVMAADFEVSEEQWAAVSAPLQPAVVIAGAGSGKTSLMAARVVFLVATGQVRADQVLGLTFTTKAAAELRARVRDALAAAGLDRGDAGSDDPDEPVEATVMTYNAYASGLLTEHGLRIGHEPDTRVMADASRYQLAARAVARHRAEVRLLSDSPRHVIDDLLALDGAMSEHLVGPDDVRAFTSRARAGFEAGLATRSTKAQREARRGAGQARRAARPRRDLPRPQVRARADGLLRPDRARRAAGHGAARRGAGRAGEVRGGAARRVPGHVGRAGAAAAAPVLRPGRRCRPRPPGDGRRRPQPGHLRLAGGVGLEHPRVRPRLPGGRRGRRRGVVPADGEPPLRQAGPRGRQPARGPALRRAPAGARAARQAGRRRRRGPRRGPRDVRRRAGVARRRGRRHPPGDGRPGLARHRGARARQRARRRRVRRAVPRRGAGRDRRPLRPAAAAGGLRGGLHPRAAARPDRQRRPAQPAHRAEVGRRTARPRAARAAGRASWPGTPAGATATGSTCTPPSSRPSPARTPRRWSH